MSAKIIRSGGPFNALQRRRYAVLPRFTADPPPSPSEESACWRQHHEQHRHTLDMAANIKGAFAVAIVDYESG
jgi:hypothetical protein